MTNGHTMNRLTRWGLAIGMAFGGLFGSSGCMNRLQHEIEVLTQPGIAGAYLYDSVLFNHPFGRNLIEFWNWGR